ncbi:coth protein-domain-containing protein [Dichotomocladium elegans]|nr:coth protein-domain-containing protein [Dichotomocladium elegans]
MRYPLAFIVAAAYANAATFKVVAPNAKSSVVVSVDGNNVPLQASDPDVPYYVGEAACATSCQYKASRSSNKWLSYTYIVDGLEESFDRTLEGDSTRNDVFGRPVTYSDIPDLPHPIKNKPEWTRGGSKDGIWDDRYLPTIFINGDPQQIESLVATVPKEKVNVKFTIIDADNVQSFKDCTFGIHGAGKPKNNAKQSWEWSLPDGQYLANRNWFKLRHMEEDPTQIREKLYSDVLWAMGANANRANLVRLFINGQGYGTFNLLDDVAQYSYIRSVFYNGNPPEEMGPLYDGMSGADFQYTESVEHYEAFAPNEESPEGSDLVMSLARAFDRVDVTDDEQIDSFDKVFNIDQFLRYMVAEYLTADWDGYWMEQTNLGIYRDPTENDRWYYLGQDYDATFGVNLDPPEGRDFIHLSYKQFPERYPKSVMINRLLENDKIRNRFEGYLKDTVRVLFNNETLGTHVLAYHEFIKPDLRWDRSIKQLSPGIDFGWTFPQTEQNLFHKVKAPNDNGGGANWGLIEWIIEKSKAVAQEFDLTIMSREEALKYGAVSPSAPALS